VKTAILKLEPYDDIVSVREKMDWSRSARILIVYPETFDFLDRKIDLLLLKRYAQNLGAQIAVVCTDIEIQQNAREAGIPFFQTAEVAQRVPWRRSRFRRAFREGQGNNLQLSELQSRARSVRAGFWQNKPLRAAIFLLAILSVVILGLFFVPSAQITMPDLKEKQQITLSIWASPAISSAQVSGGLPATEVSVVVESQGQAVSSGLAVVPARAATGNVQFTNLTSQSVRVPAGTIVLTLDSTPVKFEILQAVTVPGGGGQIAAAQIQAVQAGIQGNVSAGDIRAIEGDLGLLLTVTDIAQTLGGDNRTASSPTETDYTNLRQSVLKVLQNNALHDIQSKLAPDEKILPASLKLVSILEETQDPPAGQPSDQSRTTIRAEYSAWYTRLGDLAYIERLALDGSLTAGTAGIDGTLQSVEINSPQIVDGIARWEVKASRDMHRIWNREEIAGLVLGKNKTEASQLISSLFGISSPVIVETQPGWWPFLPALMFRIQVSVE
jgi:hypothetical protein